MSRHATGYRMDSIFNRDSALLQHVGELTHRVLRLRSRESVTGHEYDFVCVSELGRDVVQTDFAHRSLLLVAGSGCGCASEGTKQNIRERAIHRAAHQHRKYESGKPVECARDDQHFV